MQRFQRYVVEKYGSEPFAQTPITADPTTGRFIYDGHALTQAAVLRGEVADVLCLLRNSYELGCEMGNAIALAALIRSLNNCAKQLGYRLP